MVSSPFNTSLPDRRVGGSVCTAQPVRRSAAIGARPPISSTSLTVKFFSAAAAGTVVGTVCVRTHSPSSSGGASSVTVPAQSSRSRRENAPCMSMRRGPVARQLTYSVRAVISQEGDGPTAFFSVKLPENGCVKSQE